MALTLVEASERLRQLKEEITLHDAAYFQQAEPLISDEAYDALRQELRTLEKKFPTLVEQGQGPSTRVGSPVAEGSETRTHLKPLLSLDNAFTGEEVRDFFLKANRFLGLSQEYTPPLWAEPKVDGLSIALLYRQGSLISAATRGDGFRGENIMPGLTMIKNIPEILLGPRCPDVCEIRGEVFMKPQDFRILNQRRDAAGLKILATARNSAAGALRQIHPQDVASVPLYFYPHDVFAPNESFKTYTQVRETFQQWGFVPMPHARLCSTWAQVDEIYHWFVKHREGLDYESDGVVYKIDALDYQERLGFSARAPRFAVAWKFSAQEAITRLHDIILQVGRTGALTPVACLKPVMLGGVTVSRASLHNRDDIARKGLRVGQHVRVRRAGDVIPYVVGPAEGYPGSAETREFIMPDRCPVCDYPAVQEGVVVRCTGGIMCQSQALWRLRHGFSRTGLDVRGLGAENCGFFYKKGWIRQLADAFTLQQRGILELLEKSPGWGKNSVQRLWLAIQKAKNCRLSSFIYALGIPGVGETSASLLAQVYKTVENFVDDLRSLEKGQRSLLEGVGGIGPYIEKSLQTFAHSAVDRAVLSALKHEVQVETYTLGSEDDLQPLQGHSLVFTGKLNSMTRGEAKNWAQAMGAQVHSQLGKSTTMVVLGQSPTPRKVAEAAAMKIIHLSEVQWCGWVESFRKKELVKVPAASAQWGENNGG